MSDAVRSLVPLFLAALLSGCVTGDGEADPNRRWLNVVPSDGDPHVIEWADLRDGSAPASIVERGLQDAQTSRYGTSTRELNATEISKVSPWIAAHERVHNVRPLPIRFNGDLYHVGLDGMA